MGGTNNGGSYMGGGEEKKKEKNKGKKKKRGKQWKNTSSGPLAALPGPSPPQDYCTKKCYFCFNNLLRHWHSSAGLVLSSSPAPRDHCSSMAKGPDAAPRHRRALHRRLSPRPPGRRCPPGSVPVGPVPLRAGGWVAMATSPEERGGWRRRAELSSPCLRGARVGKGPGRCSGSGGPFEAGRAIERQRDPGGRQRGGRPRPLFCAGPGHSPSSPGPRGGCGLTQGPVPPGRARGDPGWALRAEGAPGRGGLRGAGVPFRG